MQDWFYHAPARRKEEREPMEYPAPSQIPGLSGVEQDEGQEDTNRRGNIKDSDSKYIRLAKAGGRKDLLQFRIKPLSEEAVPYPRTDWLDWNEEPEPDAGPRQVYLPDYMVYDEHHADPDAEPYQARRPPYSLHDNINIFEREGGKATDKTVKLPEIKRKHKRHSFQKLEGNKPAGTERSGRKQPPENRPQVNEDEPVTFNKLMSMGYQKDWVEERQKYYSKQQPLVDQRRKLKSVQAPTTSEYQERIGKGIEKPATRQNSSQRRARVTTAQKDIPLEEEKLFKLSRFNKVQAKVDTRRDDQPHTHYHPSHPQPTEA